MMLFKQPDPLLAGVWLQGAASWSADQVLTSASLRIFPPSAGVVTIALATGSSPSTCTPAGPAFVVGPGPGPIRIEIALNLPLAAGVFARWQVTAFTGAPGDCATRAEIVLQHIPATVAAGTPLPVPYTIRWVSGLEMLTLWDWSPTTYQFTDVSAGLAAGRVGVVDTGSEIRVEVAGATALRLTGAGALANEWRETPPNPALPRAEFWAGPARVGWVAAGGLVFAPALTTPSLTGAAGRFQFRPGGGASVAEWGPQDFRAPDLTEPLP